MHEIYGSYVVLTFLHTYIGVRMRLTDDTRRWLGTLLVSSYVCAFSNAPLRYESDYLFGSAQPYQQMSELVGCVMTYLLCDLLHQPKQWDVCIHHVESVAGLAFSLLGYNVGVLNNCVLGEYSSFWLVLVHFSKPFTIPFVSTLVVPISWAFFVITFVYYRIIPCVVMSWSIASDVSRATRDSAASVHTFLFCIHCSLQFYWLGKIGKLVAVRLIPRFLHVHGRVKGA